MRDRGVLRAALEERRDLVLADLVALDRPSPGAAPDPALRARLRANSERELAEVLEELSALEQPAVPPGRRRIVAAVLVAVALAGLAAVAAGTTERREGGFVTGGVASGGDEPAASAPRDLASVSDEELEEVVRTNPSVVPMRLALVERYLRGGDPVRARDHALRALEEPIDGSQRAEALKYLGWSTALVGRPAEGSALLEESLAMVPTDLDTLWFLANVRLDAGGDPLGAAALLERILADDIPEDRRRVVASRLDEARRVAADAGRP